MNGSTLGRDLAQVLVAGSCLFCSAVLLFPRIVHAQQVEGIRDLSGILPDSNDPIILYLTPRGNDKLTFAILSPSTADSGAGDDEATELASNWPTRFPRSLACRSRRTKTLAMDLRTMATSSH